jgi:hypothetical protein
MSIGARGTWVLLCFGLAILISPARCLATTSADYVGAETCKTCHEDIFKNFETTPHFKTTLTKRGPEWQGCEACHGPGKAHVESGGDKTKISSSRERKLKT